MGSLKFTPGSCRRVRGEGSETRRCCRMESRESSLPSTKPLRAIDACDRSLPEILPFPLKEFCYLHTGGGRSETKLVWYPAPARGRGAVVGDPRAACSRRYALIPCPCELRSLSIRLRVGGQILSRRKNISGFRGSWASGEQWEAVTGFYK